MKITIRKTRPILLGLLVLFISTKTAIAQIDHWETVVYEYNDWNYIVPAAPVDSEWNTLGFDTGSWLVGTGGFGYGDGDDNTVLPSGTISVFQRIEFDIIDTTKIAYAALTIDFDDSFVAYLNGVEIKRELLSGTGQPAWNQTASGLHEAQFYTGAYAAQYSISKSFLADNLNEGTNVLAIQTHNESGTSSDLSSRVYFHLAITDASTDYGLVPDWFNPPFIFETSNLPIIIVNTVDGVSIADDPKVAGTMGIIDNEDGINSVSDPFNGYYGNIGIEIRGSYTGTLPKKAYGLETRMPDSSNYNVSIFDWPADNDWILYAPYTDKSLIRNVLTYKLGAELGSYTPRTKLVELVINGEYVGVYVFMERIKQNEGRVNVNELEYDDISGNEITGGYIVKVDKTTAGGIVAWTSPFSAAAPAWGPINFQFHDPEIDEIHPAQYSYIQNYITDFETALAGPDFMDPVDGYKPYIDVNSFIDFMLINEISKNIDGYRISTFLHKQRVSEGGKLVAGPLWDFNFSWGNANYCEGGLTAGWEIDYNEACGGGGGLSNPFWWIRFTEDPEFTHALNCRWQELRMTTLHTDTIIAFIDEMEVYLEEPADRNFQKWPILGTYVWPNNFVGSTYTEEMDYLRDWATDRLSWMDANMFGSCEDLNVPEIENTDFQLFPNPTTGKTTMQFAQFIAEGRIEIRNNMGQIIAKIPFENKNQYEIDLAQYAPAIYTIQLFDKEQMVSNQKIIRQ